MDDRQPIRLLNFYNLRRVNMLIGCLEWEILKFGLKSDVNTILKSDLIVENNFNINFAEADALLE